MTAFQVTLGHRWFVHPRYSLDLGFFLNVFTLCDSILRFSSTGKKTQGCVIAHFFTSLESPCEVGVAPKVFCRVPWEKLMGKHRFLERCLFPGSLFFTWLTILNIRNIAALTLRLVNSGWLPLIFGMTKFSFAAKFLLNLC